MKSNKSAESRRSFLGKLLGGWLAVTVLPVLYVVGKYVMPPSVREALVARIAAGKLSAMPLNSAKIVKYNKKPVIVVHEQDGTVKAFSAICTHLGCVVDYDAPNKQFHCNCHDSIYDSNGQRIGGPSRLPLPAYPVTVENDEITVEAPTVTAATTKPKA